VSPATIRNHVQNILGKLGAHSRLEAVAYATRNRLI
jgi:DNA-binding NarL/FixJ family response regulator